MARLSTFWAANENCSEGARKYHALRFFPPPFRCLFIEAASEHAMAYAAHRRRLPLVLFLRQRACPLSAVR